MKIKLIESITLRSEPIACGTEIDLPAVDANQLIAAGHAEAVPDAATTKKPAKEG